MVNQSWFKKCCEDGPSVITAADNAEPHHLSDDNLIKTLMHYITMEDSTTFSDFVQAHMSIIGERAANNTDVANTLITGYKMGVNQKNEFCAHNLGALYYMGDIVEQDYIKATALYELASKWGCYQSLINLGYIYEYGRIDKPDYQKAYLYYSLSAALSPNYEALYKMGDMFSRGKPYERDLKKALDLWRRSLAVACGAEEESQPAIRIAPLLLSVDSQYEIEYDPLKALQLYQTAEIGLRISIDKGLTYYEKRLQEAILGQETAREHLGRIEPRGDYV